MFFNQCTLVGEIASDLRMRTHRKREAQASGSTVDFRLNVVRPRFQRERMSIRVVLFDGAAETFLRHKKRGDYVLVSGRLCSAIFDGKEGGKVEHHYLIAEDFRFLWGPPGRFVRGHTLVPRDEYERLKALEAEAGGPMHVPEQAAEDWLQQVPPPSSEELRLSAELEDGAFSSEEQRRRYAPQLEQPSGGLGRPRRRTNARDSV